MNKNLLTAGAIILLACTGNRDLEKPKIEILSPQNETEFSVGDTLKIAVKLQDNVALKSYKVEIHNAFDGHGHTHELAPKSAEADDHDHEAETPFSYNHTGQIADGKSEFLLNLAAPISTDAAEGEYHLIVHCTDSSGNEAQAGKEIILK